MRQRPLLKTFDVLSCLQLKGKAAIDVICNPLGKSGGALIQQVMIVAFGSLAASTPYLGVILLGIVILVAAQRPVPRQAVHGCGRQHASIACHTETASCCRPCAYAVVHQPQWHFVSQEWQNRCPSSCYAAMLPGSASDAFAAAMPLFHAVHCSVCALKHLAGYAQTCKCSRCS